MIEIYVEERDLFQTVQDFSYNFNHIVTYHIIFISWNIYMVYLDENESIDVSKSTKVWICYKKYPIHYILTEGCF